MMRLCLICNPTAQSGRGKSRWSEIEGYLRLAGIAYDMRVSEYAGHSIVLARDAALRSETVVAVGGDGTINEVLCGVMDSGVSQPSMGILYTGTSPDVCRFHGIPSRNMREAVAVLARNNRVPIDVGRVTYFASPSASHSLQQGEANEHRRVHHFLCSVNLGVGARVATGANSGLRRLFGDVLGTLISTVKAVLTYQNADFQYSVDGKRQTSHKVLNLTIGKNPFVASGIKIPADIRPDDGKLYLFVMNELGRSQAVAMLPKLYDGTIVQDSRFLLDFLREFECEYSAMAPEVEFDGDHRGYLPCAISIIPQGLRLVRNHA